MVPVCNEGKHGVVAVERGADEAAAPEARVVPASGRAAALAAALGGADNILVVDACTTRLRLRDPARADEAALKAEGAARLWPAAFRVRACAGGGCGLKGFLKAKVDGPRLKVALTACGAWGSGTRLLHRAQAGRVPIQAAMRAMAAATPVASGHSGRAARKKVA